MGPSQLLLFLLDYLFTVCVYNERVVYEVSIIIVNEAFIYSIAFSICSYCWLLCIIRAILVLVAAVKAIFYII